MLLQPRFVAGDDAFELIFRKRGENGEAAGADAERTAQIARDTASIREENAQLRAALS